MGNFFINSLLPFFSNLSHRTRQVKITKIRVVFGVILLCILYLLLTGGNRTEYATSTKPIAFQTKIAQDAALPTGFSYTKNQGKNGTEQIKTKRTYKQDGSVLRKEIVSKKQTVSPITNIVVQGTQPTDTFNKGLREKAQAFYDGYKKGSYTGSTAWLHYVCECTTIPYSDETIKQAVKETQFTIEEITIGLPKIQLSKAYGLQSKTEIAAVLPMQVRSSDILHPEQVHEFTKTAYFDPASKHWLFPPLGPILSRSETVSQHFAGAAAREDETSGTLDVQKIIHFVPMSTTWGKADHNLSLALLFTGSFADGKTIQRVELTDVRDDLGTTYTTAAVASPFSGEYNEQTEGEHVWTTFVADPKKIAGAKKLSFHISYVSENPQKTYFFFGSDTTHASPERMTLTNIPLY